MFRKIFSHFALLVLGSGLLLGAPVVQAMPDEAEAPDAYHDASYFLDLFELNAGAAAADGEITLEVLIANLIQIALGFIGLIFVVLMIYGGYLWMTATGNEDQVTKARSLIRESIIGIIIVFMAYLITAFIIQSVGQAVFEPLRFLRR